MPARCAALCAACSFGKKINSSSSKFEAQITPTVREHPDLHFNLVSDDNRTHVLCRLRFTNGHLPIQGDRFYRRRPTRGLGNCGLHAGAKGRY
ncbi:hypothetical protein J6590_038854 [Homalodisca vitripennis]|nr:hypothetical protein J6590_038854 [Homalodisca vitripennis]